MRKKLIAVSLALAVAVGSMGLAGAVAPTLDTETTDTTSTTEIDGTTTQVYNETTTSFLNTSQDSNQTAVEIRQGADGRLLANYTLNESDNVQHVATATGTYYHATELADDASDYPGIEADAGETVTIEARSINLADSPQTTTNTTFSFTNGQNVSFAFASDNATSTSEQTGSRFTFLGNDSDAGSAQIEENNVGINGDTQETITVTLGNADAQASAAEVFDKTEGDAAPSAFGVATVNSQPILVFAAGEETPEWFDEDEHAFATVSEDGQTITVENAGMLVEEGDSQADVEIVANDAIGFNTARTLAADNGASFLDAVGFGIDALNANGTPEFEEAV